MDRHLGQMSRFYHDRSRCIMNGWDFIMNGWDFIMNAWVILHKVESLLCSVEIYHDRFNYERWKFSWWCIIASAIFHHPFWWATARYVATYIWPIHPVSSTLLFRLQCEVHEDCCCGFWWKWVHSQEELKYSKVG